MEFWRGLVGTTYVASLAILHYYKFIAKLFIYRYTRRKGDSLSLSLAHRQFGYGDHFHFTKIDPVPL